MAMTLQLSDEESEALRQYAEQHGQTMDEAAHEAVRKLIHNARRDAMARTIIERDRELLDRLAE